MNPTVTAPQTRQPAARLPGQAGGLPDGAARRVPARPQVLSRPTGSHAPPWTVQSKRPGPTMEPDDGRGGDKGRLLGRYQGTQEGTLGHAQAAVPWALVLTTEAAEGSRQLPSSRLVFRKERHQAP